MNDDNHHPGNNTAEEFYFPPETPDTDMHRVKWFVDQDLKILKAECGD